MTAYKIETKEFGLSDNGIHLLRKRFNYKTIDYKDIDLLIVETDKELNNWILLFVVGLGLSIFSIWYIYRLFLSFNNNDVIYADEIVVPVLPLLTGIYFIYSSTKTGQIIKVTTKDKQLKKLSLADLEKHKSTHELTSILRDKLHGRLKINL